MIHSNYPKLTSHMKDYSTLHAHEIPETDPSPLSSGLDWPNTSQKRRKFILLYKITSAFFLSNDWKRAWILLLICLIIQFGAVNVFSWETDINKALFDALQYKHVAMIPKYIIEFVLVGSLVYSLTYFGAYIENVLEMLWRNRITSLVSLEWLSKEKFYFIERAELVENADQRIAEDIRFVISGVFGVFMGSLRSVYTIVVFTLVLIKNSTPLEFHLFGHKFITRYDILVSAYISSIFATMFIFRVGRKLTRLNMRQQHYEADLRFSLMSVRKHAEQIAFMRRGLMEHLRIVTALSSLVRNYFAQQRMSVIISFLMQLIDHIQKLLPLVLTIPRYLNGQMTFGGITQTQSVFGRLSSSLTWLMQVYPMYSETNASFDRLFVLFDAIMKPKNIGIVVKHAATPDISFENISISLPGRPEPILKISEWSISRGDKWVISGASGSGKSTLLRVVAGLWHDGKGTISLPKDARITFLPQLPYLPHGTLIELMLPGEQVSEAGRKRCIELLRQFHLSSLVDKLDIGGDWTQRLSPGEQQRFALARAFVSLPDILILDEATSALDDDTTRSIYSILLACDTLTIISVSHSVDVVRQHTKCLHISDGVGNVSHTEKLPSLVCTPSSGILSDA